MQHEVLAHAGIAVSIHLAHVADEVTGCGRRGHVRRAYVDSGPPLATSQPVDSYRFPLPLRPLVPFLISLHD